MLVFAVQLQSVTTLSLAGSNTDKHDSVVMCGTLNFWNKKKTTFCRGTPILHLRYVVPFGTNGCRADFLVRRSTDARLYWFVADSLEGNNGTR